MVDFVVGFYLDPMGKKIADALWCKYMDFFTEYYPEGAPAPKIKATYEEIKGKHILTVRRTQQYSDRNTLCRFLINYPRISNSLLDRDTFNAAKVDVFHPSFILHSL